MATETECVLTVNGVGSVTITFDRCNAWNGFAEYRDERTNVEYGLNQDQVNAVCEFIDEKMPSAG